MFDSTVDKQTIIAPATAAGEGALGIIRLSGPDAITISNHIFKGSDLTQAESHTVHYGHIVDGERMIDEVLVSLFKAPRSFTTEDVVEISCHGSPYIIEQVIHTAVRKGAVIAQPGEFTFRAFMNGRIDLSQAEAVADLIGATSKLSHQVALNQMRGGFSNELKALREELIRFAALIELELDFSEEDVEFANRSQLEENLNSLQQVIQQLIESFQLGNVLKHGVHTAIIGRPNAGKSTLLNAVLNEERAIVSDIAGTTRDVIEEVLHVEGVAFRFIDTAGIRESTDAIEKLGIQRTFEKVKEAAVCLYLFDASTATPQEVLADLDSLHQQNKAIIPIANKIDCVAPDQLAAFEEIPNLIQLSAKTKDGLEALKKRLYQDAIGSLHLQEQTIVTNSRHYDALQLALEALQQVLTGLNAGISGDLLALDIRTALRHLGHITGSEIDVDKDILGSIFSSFCIGK